MMVMTDDDSRNLYEYKTHAGDGTSLRAQVLRVLGDSHIIRHIGL
jgi:hypothetical protein